MTSAIKNTLALVISIIVIHLFYAGYVWPESSAVIEAARVAGQSAPRDLAVIIKDWEQEICIIMMLWGSFLILDKCFAIMKDRYLFNVDLLEGAAEGADGEDDLASMLEALENLPPRIRTTPLVRTLSASLRRFLITANVQNTSEAIDSSLINTSTNFPLINNWLKFLVKNAI